MNKKIVLSSMLIALLSHNAVNADNHISEKNLRKHVTTLASDSFIGRFPGTQGDTLSSQYILDELKAIPNIKLWNGDGRQRFNFALKEKHSQEESSILFTQGESLKWNDDFYPTAFSASGVFKYPVAFAGYGFNTESRNDYKNVNIAGKWALILRELPCNGNRYLSASSDYAKVQEAINHGATGVLLVHGERDRWQLLESTDLWYPQADVPVICISRKAANKILKENNVTIEGLEKECCTAPCDRTIVTNNAVTANLKITRVKQATQNIIATIEGSDKKLMNEVVVIAGHYDHQGYKVYNGLLGAPSSKEQVFNGADDNASGCAGMLELARLYSSKHKDLKRSVMFVFLGAEERGLVGSKYFTYNLNQIDKKVVQMVNLDMIGYLAHTDSLLVYGVGTYAEGKELVSKVKPEGIKVKVDPKMGITSDHIPFNVQNIPVTGFFTGGHKEVHTPFDDIDKIDFKGMKSIIDYSTNYLDYFLIKGGKISFNNIISK